MGSSSHSNAYTLIVPIAADLTHDGRGRVIVGPITKAACDLAVHLASQLERPWLLTTATRAGEVFIGEMMGHVMQSYMNSLIPKEQDVSFNEARWFNTMGEALAVAEYVQKMHRDTRVRFEQVVIVVKNYHLARTRMLVDRIFSFKRIQVPVSFHSYEWPTDESMLKHEKRGMLANRMLLNTKFLMREITREL